MANSAKGWNLKNRYVQRMENKEAARDRYERVRLYEEAKRIDREEKEKRD